MPISRYEIRNEYSLADPELYRAADKDDPEALLEGVAMAGLVGVLRQLGDLAEFAAEIFHNLHEEVMATAARGHGIMVRVQQLETEIPSIEKAFLSQTDHSSFFYHAGVDWHPNLQLDHNLITQGDLPRFIMDSYEECRAPPRLFLLDKFDVAGAGACLKRYTDPSFFKVETSEIISADVQREKKIRKIKKKGPRLKNGETPEVLPTTHTKLHQLFLEERVETGVGKPSFRAKLKRRLNGFPFDSKTGKSYMEKLLKSPSPDHEVLHEVAMTSSPLLTATNDNKESSFEVFEIRRFSPDRASWGRTRSPPSSPDEEENMLNPSTYEPNKSSIDDKLWEVPDSCSSIATNGISSTIDNVTRKKLGAVYGEGDKEERLTGYQSDDIASEIDNFVDAPSNMESEMDGDSELRVKSDISSSHTKNESLISNAYEENLHTRLSDSSSPGDSTISDDGNNSSTKEMSNSSSESSSTSVANSQGENTSAKGFQYNDVPANELVDASSYNKTADEDFDVDHSTPVVSDDTCTETDAITNHRSELEQLTYLLHPDSEEVVMESILKAPESDEIVTTLDDEEKKANLVIDPPRSPSLCGFESQSEDDSTGSSAGERQVYGLNSEGLSSLSTEPDVYCHTADSSGETSLDSLHEDESDVKDCGLVDDVASTSNMLHNSTNGTPEAISSENPIPDRLHFPEVPENPPSSYTVAEHYGDNIDSAVSNGDNLSSVLDDEDSSGATDSPDHFPREASLEKRLEGTSLANAETVNVEDNFASSSIENQISSDNFRLSQQADSPDRATEGLDVHTGVVIPEEDATRDETLSLETSKPCEVAGSQDIGITHHVFPNDPESLESSCYNPEDHEEPAGKADSVDMSSSREEVTEISGSADLESVNEVHVLLYKSDSEADKSNSSAVPAVSDNRDLDKLVEEHHTCFEESGVDENDVNHPSECHGESDVVERAGPTEASASCFETVFSNAVNNNHPESESSSIARNSHLDIEVDDHGPEFVHASTTNLPSEQCGVDREQELFNHSGLQNHTPDAHSLLVDNDIEESRAQEKSGLPLSQLDQESLHPGETSSVFSFPLPVNNQQMIDHDDDFKQDDDPPFFSELPRPSNREIDVPGYPKDPLSSIFSPINPFSDTNQINLSDIEPLPPLPPVQWRMGKLQHASSSTDGEMERHNELSAQLVSPQTVPSDIVSSPPPPTSTDVVGSSTLTTSTNDINFSPEEVKHPPIEIPLETASKESINNSSSSLEANSLVENKQQDIVKTTTETVSTPPAEEDGTENESRTAKLPRLRNPLVDDVSVLDKSKLRKVSERVRPEIEKVDERDSLLEQIRTKSFNLKPAMASRPSIRGPNTNLKVAAILEKANAIRQAFAGSDEDDSDSWSDS